MRFTKMLTASAIALLTLAALPRHLQAEESHHAPGVHTHYSLTDLGVLGTGNNSAGYDMNDFSWVAGSSNFVPNGPQHAFLWYGGGSLKDLGTLGGPNSAADGPNLFGEAPVISEIAAADPDGEDFCGYGTHLQCRGAIWRHGRLIPLRRLPGGRNAFAIGINNLAQVVGWAENGIYDSTCSSATPSQVYRFDAVRWDADGSIHTLSPLVSAGDTVAFSFGINDRGQAVGSSGSCATQGLPPANVTGLHAVLWEKDGTPKYLGTLGDGSNTKFNAAASINNRGEVVGTSQFTDGTVHSFRWRESTGMEDLGTLPGAFATIAGCCRTINMRGEVVGFSIDGTGSTAFVWKDGVIADLNTLIPADSRLHLLNAESLNDEGEIVGQACVLPACTELHAYLARPNRR